MSDDHPDETFLRGLAGPSHNPVEDLRPLSTFELEAVEAAVVPWVKANIWCHHKRKVRTRHGKPKGTRRKKFPFLSPGEVLAEYGILADYTRESPNGRVVFGDIETAIRSRAKPLLEAVKEHSITLDFNGSPHE